jgi:phage shock protein A
VPNERTLPAHFFIRTLAFSGPKVPVARLDFCPTVNVIWGASNAGKSFIVKALDFMTGAGSPLPDIEEINGYERGWLGLDLPMSGSVTLTRAVKGGELRLYESAVEPGTESQTNRVLSADHRASADSVSGFLLAELGITDKRIARTLTGDKSSFTFRHVAPYMLTEETNMMAEWSPIRISDRSGDTFDKNVLKFLLTGVDDAAVVATKSVDAQKDANSGKIELIDEMIAGAELELQRRFPDHAELAERDEKISKTIDNLQTTLTSHQDSLDALRKERRFLVESLADANERRTEIEIMLDRFETLRRVYESDVARLMSLAEGSAALLAGSHRSCPLCGADPEHQRHEHGFDEIKMTQVSVVAEIEKIQVARADLMKATASLRAEAEGLATRALRSAERLEKVDDAIEKAKPLEASSRKSYEDLDKIRDHVRQGLELTGRIADMKARRTKLEAFKASRPKRESVQTGVGGVVGHELAMHVQSVLHAWRFPGLQTVSFDDKSHDILINGKGRKGNGKGVRALMNAAFKIGILLFCKEKGLPHPGVIVLDSPLLSYRDPIKSRHGALADDEKEVVRMGLNEHFYRFLLEKASVAQFIIIENYEPPVDLGPTSRVVAFVGPGGEGDRKGFF